MSVPEDTDRIAGLKAERRTDLQFDFDLEDIIAGNLPVSEVGQKLAALVEDVADAPTQGRIETALLPLYETVLSAAYSDEGGAGEPPAPNRGSIRQIAIKAMQARKVRRTTRVRAAGGGKPRPRSSNYSPVAQLVIIALLLAGIALVLYAKG